MVGWRILHDWGLVKKFGISEEVLRKWLASVQSAYHRSNAFHNATHGSDVMQTTHYILKTANAQKYFSDLEVFAVLVAAVVHDMGHDGYSNNFHKNAMTSRAIRFNDQSIQEMHHASSFFEAMQQDDSINILKSFVSAPPACPTVALALMLSSFPPPSPSSLARQRTHIHLASKGAGW